MARRDPGEFDFWSAKELPGTPPNWKDGGEFDYWGSGEGLGELPPPAVYPVPAPVVIATGVVSMHKLMPLVGVG